MYGTSKYLSSEIGEYVSPNVIRYLSNKFNWIRNVTDLNPCSKAILNGSVPESFYSHLRLEIPEDVKRQYLNGTTKMGGEYDG